MQQSTYFSDMIINAKKYLKSFDGVKRSVTEVSLVIASTIIAFITMVKMYAIAIKILWL